MAAKTTTEATANDPKVWARQILAGVFDGELDELRVIETQRRAMVQQGESLRAELADAERHLDATRDALALLPAELQAAQLEADAPKEAEVQERHHRLSRELEAAEARLAAARAENDRDGHTALDAARVANQRAWRVRERSRALLPAVAAELEARIVPVLEGSGEIQKLLQTLQAYR